LRLDGKTITVGVTGGIAVYKVCELVSRLRKAGADVHVVMTQHATEFVSPLTFETLSANRVVCDMFDRDFEWEVEHVSLAKQSDLFVVAPCTANFIGKMASGIADDFLTTTAMAMTCPVLLAPAMNTAMLESAAQVENAAILEKRGVHFVYGDSGFLACGDKGAGRMAEPVVIASMCEEIIFPRRDFEGKTVLITAGATREPIDPVRFITNRSSGKMGLRLAEEAVRRGADVILVAGLMTATSKETFNTINVTTTEEMYNAVMDNLQRADVIIKAAAPADYSVKNYSDSKVKSENLILELKKNPDIAKSVGENKGNKKLIIFCAETNDLKENAYKKLIAKNADMIVANDVLAEGAGFDVDTNIASILTKDSSEDLPKMTKAQLATRILDKIVEL